MAALEAELKGAAIDVLIVDPFVSSHQVEENDNGAIDMVAKEWAALADRCNCAIELVHHTSKAYGTVLTTEMARGASALISAARSARVFNRMTDEERESAGIKDPAATYFNVTRDKANLAPPSGRVWRRMVSVDLGQGDHVGVAEQWDWPDDFDGLKPDTILQVQKAIDGRVLRYSDQSPDWVGLVIADVLHLHPKDDRRRIKRMIETWLGSGVLAKGEAMDSKRMKRPTVEVGEWMTE